MLKMSIVEKIIILKYGVSLDGWVLGSVVGRKRESREGR